MSSCKHDSINNQVTHKSEHKLCSLATATIYVGNDFRKKIKKTLTKIKTRMDIEETKKRARENNLKVYKAVRRVTFMSPDDYKSCFELVVASNKIMVTIPPS